MQENSRARPPDSNGMSSESRRKDFVVDDVMIELITHPLNYRQWADRFTELRNKIKVEYSEYSRDDTVNIIFKTLRAFTVGLGAIMSLNIFERDYYHMEYRIKTQKVGRICSKSSERVVDWALECVLDETEAAKLTEVDMDYILGGRKAHQYAHVEYKGSDDNQGNAKASSNAGRGVNYPQSDTTILGSQSVSGNQKPSQHRLIDRNRHKKTNYNDSPSTHYMSPSTLATASLEAFSPMPSPVRENKKVEESWGDGCSRFLTTYSEGEPVPQPVSSLESSGLLAASRYPSPTPKSRGGHIQGKALPSLPYFSPLMRRGLVKGRSSSEPMGLKEGDPKKPGVGSFRSPRTSSTGTGTRICVDAGHEDFRSLQSRTPTPTGRIADDETLQKRQRRLEVGKRSSIFSAKTSMTTTSETSVVTVTQYSQLKNILSTPPNKVSTRDILRTPSPRGVNQLATSPSYSDSSPEPQRHRCSITPSLLSSPERGNKFGARGGIYVNNQFQRSPFQREDSAASTIFSAATNSTGDIPSLAHEISLDASARCHGISGVPKLIEVTKHVYGSSTAVPAKSVNTVVGDNMQMHPDSTNRRVNSYGNSSTSRAPSAQNIAKRSNDPEAKEVIQRDTKTPPTSGITEAQKPAIFGPLAGEQPIYIATGGQAGPVNPGRSRNRTHQNDIVVRTKKGYMQPLAKSGLSTPRRNHSRNLSTIPNKSSSRLTSGGQTSGMRDEGQASPDLRNGRGVDSLRRQRIAQDAVRKDKFPTATAGSTSRGKTPVTAASTNTFEGSVGEGIPEVRNAKSKESLKGVVLGDITAIGCTRNPRTTPITGRNWFGRRGNEIPTISRPILIPGLMDHIDTQKENSRPSRDQQYQPLEVTPKAKAKPLGNFTNWLSSGRKSKEKLSPPPPNGHFSQEEVEDLIKRLSAQIPQTPDRRNGFSVLGGKYYSLSIPSLDKSPSKDEKSHNPIAVCMDLINAASNEPQSPRRESLLQMSRVMVDAVSKSRDAECAAEEAKMAASRAEVAFLETRKHLAEMTEMMKRRKQEV